MKAQRRPLIRLVFAAAALALLTVGCGGDDDTTATGGTATVNVGETDDLGEILVDSNGNALYVNDQEASGSISCVDACLDFWPPLTIDGEPTTSGDITAEIGTVERPDGTVQVTLDGAPLYTFTSDDSPGSVSGNGVSDDFDGVTFTWQVATPSGQPPAPPDSEDDDGNGPYGY